MKILVKITDKLVPIHEFYGLHNMPSLSAGTIAARSGEIMSSEDDFTIEIHGKGGHASSPHLGVDPVEQAVVSCTELHTAGAHNAIPSNVVITGDVRSCVPEVQRLIESRMRDICESICQMNHAACDFSYTHEFKPTVNWPECAALVVKEAKSVVGADHVVEDCKPWMASEDFGTFLEKVPDCFFILGSGTDPVPENNIPLHNANFDYNDEVLLTGAELFAEIVRMGMPVQ